LLYTLSSQILRSFVYLIQFHLQEVKSYFYLFLEYLWIKVIVYVTENYSVQQIPDMKNSKIIFFSISIPKHQYERMEMLNDEILVLTFWWECLLSTTTGCLRAYFSQEMLFSNWFDFIKLQYWISFIYEYKIETRTSFFEKNLVPFYFYNCFPRATKYNNKEKQELSIGEPSYNINNLCE